MNLAQYRDEDCQTLTHSAWTEADRAGAAVVEAAATVAAPEKVVEIEVVVEVVAEAVAVVVVECKAARRKNMKYMEPLPDLELWLLD